MLFSCQQVKSLRVSNETFFIRFLTLFSFTTERELLAGRLGAPVWFFSRLCASAMDKARHSVYNMGRQFLKEKYYALD